MGKTFENLTWDDLCDLMCGGPEEDDFDLEPLFLVHESLIKKKEVQEQMEIYQTGDGRTYVTIDLTFDKNAALTKANQHFKVKKDRLGVAYGWEKGDELFFSETKGAKKCWLIWRKLPNEK